MRRRETFLLERRALMVARADAQPSAEPGGKSRAESPVSDPMEAREGPPADDRDESQEANPDSDSDHGFGGEELSSGGSGASDSERAERDGSSEETAAGLRVSDDGSEEPHKRERVVRNPKLWVFSLSPKVRGRGEFERHKGVLRANFEKYGAAEPRREANVTPSWRKPRRDGRQKGPTWNDFGDDELHGYLNYWARGLAEHFLAAVSLHPEDEQDQGERAWQDYMVDATERMGRGDTPVDTSLCKW